MELPMIFFTGRLTLRILLLLLSSVFFFYMPDILDVNHPGLGVPYVCATCFLVFVALFCKFPSMRPKKKKEDVSRVDPQTMIKRCNSPFVPKCDSGRWSGVAFCPYLYIFSLGTLECGR